MTLWSIHLLLTKRIMKNTLRQIQSMNIPNHTPVSPMLSLSTKM